MKKFIALGAALIVLLLGFVASDEVVMVENSGVQVCDDLPLPIHPFDSIF